MNAPTLLSIAVASFLGSAHCAGMCGGFVVAYAGADDSARRSHVVYHVARLASYATLGAISGLVGHAIDLAGSAAGYGTTAAVVAGSLMMLWGLAAMLKSQGVRLPGASLSSLSGVSASVIARFRAQSATGRALTLGSCSALLPCGWLYAFAVSAAGTASPLWGAILMAAFWSGTLPALLGLGAVTMRLSRPLRSKLPFVSATLILSVGLFTVISRANLPSFANPTASGVKPSCACHHHAEHSP